LMTAIMVINQATMMVIPKELVYLVIELLGSDPVWWLEEGGRGRIRKIRLLFERKKSGKS